MAKQGTQSIEQDAKSHPRASAQGGYLKTEWKLTYREAEKLLQNIKIEELLQNDSKDFYYAALTWEQIAVEKQIGHEKRYKIALILKLHHTIEAQNL